MEVLLIRHGQSEGDLEDRHEGRADFPLTELGVKQAQLLARWLKTNYPPELLITSTLKRAQETAKIISEVNQCPLMLEARLLEWDNGLLAGLLRREAAKLYPLPQGGRLPHHKLAETESLIEFRARAETFWSSFKEEYLKKSKYKRLALISHGGMINMLFHSLLALPMASDYVFASGDTAVHLWRFKDERQEIIFMNKQEHLMEVGDGTE